MNSLNNFLERAAHVLVLCGAVLVGAMALHVIADVLSRYILNMPLPGTVAFVAYYYMVGVIFLPLAYVQSRREHFFAEVATQRLSPRFVCWLDACAGLATTALLVFLTWRTGAYALTFTKAGASVETGFFAFPTWPARWLVPIGLGLMALQTIVQAILLVRGQRPYAKASE